MFRYIAKRVLQAIPLLFVISFIVFSLIHIAPYDVIDSITTPNMSQEQIDLLRQRYGLDQPFFVGFSKQHFTRTCDSDPEYDAASDPCIFDGFIAGDHFGSVSRCQQRKDLGSDH